MEAIMVEGRSSRAQTAMAIILDTERQAEGMGVEFHADYDEGRMMFSINRGEAPKGSGATVIRSFLERADAADIPVCLDVMESRPRLVEYYWDFGFRLVDGNADIEHASLAELRSEIANFLRKPGNAPSDYGVTNMWRNREAGPLTAA